MLTAFMVLVRIEQNKAGAALSAESYMRHHWDLGYVWQMCTQLETYWATYRMSCEVHCAS